MLNILRELTLGGLCVGANAQGPKIELSGWASDRFSGRDVSDDLLPPPPPAEKATARQDQAGQFSWSSLSMPVVSWQAPARHPARGWSAETEQEYPVLLEYAKASFERIKQRLRHLWALARVKRALNDYTLANNLHRQFGDVTVGLRKILLSMIHGLTRTPTVSFILTTCWSMLARERPAVGAIPDTGTVRTITAFFARYATNSGVEDCAAAAGRQLMRLLFFLPFAALPGRAR
jgi:hypothetical protein